jgi:hypothetical protein
MNQQTIKRIPLLRSNRRKDECRCGEWSQPPYKEANSVGGTKLAQFVGTTCKFMIYNGIKRWPETGSNTVTHLN